jgi:hypothetical protein
MFGLWNTAHALAIDRYRTLEAGFSDRDIKSIDLPNLLQEIESPLNSEESS